jgi:two-component system OmpR family sensor kinase
MSAPKIWSLKRRLHVRLLIATLIAVLFTTLGVGIHYGSDIQDLRQRKVLELAEEFAAVAGQSASLPEMRRQIDQSETVFHSYPGAYGWMVYDRDGRVTMLSSPDWQDHRLPIDGPLGADEWTHHTDAGDVWWASKSFVYAGERWRIVVVAIGDPAGILSRLIAGEMLIHIVLPIAPLALLFAWTSLRVVTATLQPLSVLANDARRARDFTTIGRLDAAAAPAEIRDLVISLNESLAELSRIATREREFILDAAHALRTPLAAIKARLELNADDNDATLAAVASDVSALIRLTSQMLALANSEHIAIKSEQRTDISAVAVDVIKRLAPIAYQKKVDLGISKAEPTPLIQADPDALTHALTNLIENALKHAPPYTQVDVLILADPPTIEVRDYGAGIDSALLPEAGRRFSRQSFKNGEGAGLGLSIVSRIAEAHQGTLRLTNCNPGLSAAIVLPAMTLR